MTTGSFTTIRDCVTYSDVTCTRTPFTSVEVLAASDKLVYDILLFVKKKYPQTDYELFRLKEYEAKCSYRHLSAYAGISASAIHRRISDITDTIRNHEGFSKRYAHVSM